MLQKNNFKARSFKKLKRNPHMSRNLRRNMKTTMRVTTIKNTSRDPSKKIYKDQSLSKKLVVLPITQ